jgi:hypothetical protein
MTESWSHQLVTVAARIRERAVAAHAFDAAVAADVEALMTLAARITTALRDSLDDLDDAAWLDARARAARRTRPRPRTEGR